MLGEIISKNDRDEHYKILSVYYALVSENTKCESHYYKYDARSGFIDHYMKAKKLEFVFTVEGFSSNIFQLNSWDADVTFSDLLPVGVCAEFESAMNNPVNKISITTRTNVFAQAVTAFPLLHFAHIINHELSEVVVSV